MQEFIREVSLIGEDAFNRISRSKVAVFGLGGVGSFVAESLTRAGVGTLLICDNDVIAPHNINRQLYALNSTVGKYKTEVAYNRIKDINPTANVIERREYYCADNAASFDLSSFDYIADCIDSVTSKILLVENAKNAQTPIISCMGTGNKLFGNFIVSDISKTKVCPLARVMRRELSKREIFHLKVVYSEEQPLTPLIDIQSSKRQTPASISFIPSAAGLALAGEIIRDLMKEN